MLLCQQEHLVAGDEADGGARWQEETQEVQLSLGKT